MRATNMWQEMSLIVKVQGTRTSANAGIASKLKQQHVALLDSRALEITHALTAYRRPVDDEPRMADTAKAQLEDCLKALTVVTKQLMHDHTLRAVTLLGVRATPAAARTMAACCITGLSFVVRVLMVAAADKASSQDIL